jgi:hypothetical protein
VLRLGFGAALALGLVVVAAVAVIVVVGLLAVSARYRTKRTLQHRGAKATRRALG